MGKYFSQKEEEKNKSFKICRIKCKQTIVLQQQKKYQAFIY